MTEHLKVQKTEQKVKISFHTGEPQWGLIYICPGERLQDVVNDSRPFLPIRILKTSSRHSIVEDKYDLVLVNKHSIFKIEEMQ